MASPRYEESSEQPALDVHRLEGSLNEESDSVVMVKLTDEIFNALLAAHQKRKALQIHVDDKGGSIDLGDLGVFHYQTQAVSGETDTLQIDSNGGVHRNAGSFSKKYQIQATDKSFAETREKAQKLIEGEKSRGVKDANKHRKGAVGASRVGSASCSRNASPLLAKPSSDSRISPNKFNSTGTNGLASSANNGSVARQVNPLAADLRKRKLRQRVVHLVVTGRYGSADEVYRQLRKDGISEDQESRRRIDEMVKELSDKPTSDTGKLSLKQSAFAELDPRWPWFSHEEKATVRRLLSAGQQHLMSSDSAFAPMRKSGMERMQAPGQQNERSASQNASPEAIPTPPTSRPSSGGTTTTSVTPAPAAKKFSPPLPSKKTSPPLLTARPRDSPVVTPVYESTEETALSVSASKRKAHVPSTMHSGGSGGGPEKRPRQESASPPEDPTNHHHIHNQKEKLSAARAGGSAASSRLSSPCSLSSPSQPSCDWEKMFPEAKNVLDAEKYFSMFHSDYSTYMDCYRRLNEVAKEFRLLEQQLKLANRQTSIKIERTIQDRFAHFEKDEEFLKTRQRHADLRSKLSVLKQRISEFDRSQDNSQAPVMSTSLVL